MSAPELLERALERTATVPARASILPPVSRVALPVSIVPVRALHALMWPLPLIHILIVLVLLARVQMRIVMVLVLVVILVLVSRVAVLVRVVLVPVSPALRLVPAQTLIASVPVRSEHALDRIVTVRAPVSMLLRARVVAAHVRIVLAQASVARMLVQGLIPTVSVLELLARAPM